ncbi:nucleoside recognition domain-containing protein [Klebsiella pneumoniae]|uniref:nucleoside recognition domain-containing protein n=1 Tax=Klebsiella pneumoniae TaxID=573 RepID=UPI0034E30ED5
MVLIGLSLSLTDDSGLKERITATLDPWLRKLGLSGQDLIPVLSGFGCNVVAVFQSRSCSRCTRHACISMIALGPLAAIRRGRRFLFLMPPINHGSLSPISVCCFSQAQYIRASGTGR